MKKGFTLIELIAVIAIIGVLMVFIIPSVTKMNKNIKEKEYQSIIEDIKTAAVLYAHDEITAYPSSVELNTLINEDYINANEVNGNNGCNNSGGCIKDIRDNSIINNFSITLTKPNSIVIATVPANIE